MNIALMARPACSASPKPAAIKMEKLAEIKPIPNDENFPSPEFSSPDLNNAALRSRSGLLDARETIERNLVDPQTAALQAFISQMHEQWRLATDHLLADAALITQGKGKDFIRRLRVLRMEFSRSLREEIGALVDDNKESMMSEVFRECFDRLDFLAADSEEVILVTQEAERLMPRLDDSFYSRRVKQLKRWRGNARRFFGSGSELKRVIPLRRLVRYHCVFILPQRLTRAANFIGAQTLIAFRTARNLFDRIDQHYESVITYVERGDGDQLAQSEIRDLLKESRQSLQEKFAEAALELEQFDAKIKYELTTVFAEAYAALIRDLAIAGTFELPRRRFRYSKAADA